jgi:hypothetical protein
VVQICGVKAKCHLLPVPIEKPNIAPGKTAGSFLVPDPEGHDRRGMSRSRIGVGRRLRGTGRPTHPDCSFVLLIGFELEPLTDCDELESDRFLGDGQLQHVHPIASQLDEARNPQIIHRKMNCLNILIISPIYIFRSSGKMVN